MIFGRISGKWRIQMKNRISSIALKCFFVMFLLLVFSFILPNENDFYDCDKIDFDAYNESEMRTVSAGNRIVNALEDYCSSNGKYPNKLEELVPIYIKKIPKTAYRRLLVGFYIPFDYCYYDENDNDFILSCRYHIFSELYYNSREKKWKYANH